MMARIAHCESGGARIACGRSAKNEQVAVVFTMGLAGHIDYGKSALLRVLTQMSPNRLHGEQKRRMTIDSPFSWRTFECAETFSLIDVSGHKNFVKNVVDGLRG